MTMGRGSCTKVTLIVMLVIIWSPIESYAASHVVGDNQGWGFSVSYSDWAKGKSFASGDTLVFNYQPGLHNVVLVTAAGYKNCKAPGAAEAATSGNDNLTLKKGANYFICSIPGHCSAGMKLQVVAE
ncbi:basic blue protein-like [Dioscorea cayenensis subsp. rotundata]|uniref:Plantacyanin n=1 Tax=Dioscorea cayennensis subsp. rotundata TaxID=55577 RepID=A0AB40BDL3_DIOCR|nr:basic blue protein-like [Dioscorea cayenensis subsp. rotundata]